MSGTITLLTADSPSIGSAFGPPRWGIYAQDGSEVLIVDSVAAVEYVRDYRISDYPQEKGAFQSYNKVQTPYHAPISFLIGPNRRNFLANVEAACASLDLYVVTTPEISYGNANIIHYSYRREWRRGTTMILVEVWCEEVRIVGQARLGSINSLAPAGSLATKSTNAATATQSGSMQAISPTLVQGGYLAKYNVAGLQ